MGGGNDKKNLPNEYKTNAYYNLNFSITIKTKRLFIVL